MKTKTKKGFTLVELVIVIAVIAILAAVLIPTFANLIQKANLSADQVAVRNMNTALATSEVENEITNVNDARGALYEAGFHSSNLLPTTKEHTFYWYETDNKVILTDKNSNIVYPDEYNGKNTTDLGVGKTFPLGNLPYAIITQAEIPTILTSSNVGSYSEGTSTSSSIDSDITLNTELKFKAIHTVQEAEKLPYGKYYCDYVITINKDLNATGTNYYIAGMYEGYLNGKWIVFDVTGSKTGSYYLLSEILSQKSWTYEDICLIVQEFSCGIAVTGTGDSELVVTVELVMWETESDYIGKTNGQVINTYIYSYDNN